MISEFTERQPNILIVDDNPDMVEYIATLLEEKQYKTTTCDNGNKALELIKKKPVDLVVLDILMPDADGFTVARQMKEYFGHDNFIPIILLSALLAIVLQMSSLADWIVLPGTTNPDKFTTDS